MERNLTNDKVSKTILYFSLPYILSYFLQTLYGMADLFMIGRFHGVDGTTAVSIGSQVMHMLTVMIVGLAMGATVMIARAVGGRNEAQANRAVGNTVTLFMALSIGVTALLICCARPIVSVMSTPKEAVSGTMEYLMVCFAGIPFITAYNVISAIFRGMGDSKSPMFIIAVSCALNIILDYVFIGILDLGPMGAALGTTLSQTISVMISVIVIWKRNRIPGIRVEDFKLKRNTLSNILKVGIPIALQDGFIQISFIVVTIFANHRGLNDAAAVGIVEKLIGMLFLIPSSMLSTVSALSAQNIGAGKHDRARLVLRYSMIITISFGVISAVFMQFYAEPVIALFSSNQQVINSGGQYMHSYVWDCIFAGIHFCFSGYFCAYGLSGISFIHNFISICLARIPLAWLGAKYFKATLFPMGLSAPAGSVLSVIICIGAYLWMNRHPESVRIHITTQN